MNVQVAPTVILGIALRCHLQRVASAWSCWGIVECGLHFSYPHPRLKELQHLTVLPRIALAVEVIPDHTSGLLHTTSKEESHWNLVRTMTLSAMIKQNEKRLSWTFFGLSSASRMQYSLYSNAFRTQDSYRRAKDPRFEAQFAAPWCASTQQGSTVKAEGPEFRFCFHF